MKVRRWVQCGTSLPDDGIEDELDIIQPSGKNVAEAMFDILLSLGCKGDLQVYRLGDDRWEFVCRYGPIKIHCIVAIIFDCVVIFRDDSLFRSWFKTVHPQYLELLKKIADALPKDERFSNVRW